MYYAHKADMTGGVEPRMKDSVMFTPSGEQKQGERFAAYPVMRATNPCLVLDKTDARTTAPATITELNGTGGTVQFQTGHYWKKDTKATHTLSFSFDSMPPIYFTPKVGMKVRVGTRTVFSSVSMTGLRWPTLACMELDCEAISHGFTKVLDASSLQALTHLNPHLVIGQSRNANPHPLNFPAEFENFLGMAILNPKGGKKTGKVLAEMLLRSYRAARQTLDHAISQGDQNPWNSKLESDFSYFREALEREEPKLSILINPFNFTSIKEAEWPEIIADFVNSNFSIAKAVGAIHLLRRAKPNSSQSNFRSINPFGDALESTRGTKTGIAHLTLIEPTMQFLQWVPEYGPMALANNRSRLMCITYGPEEVPIGQPMAQAPGNSEGGLSQGDHTPMDEDGSVDGTEHGELILMVSTPKSGAEQKGIKERLALGRRIKKRTPATASRKDMVALQLHFSNDNDRHATMLTLQETDPDGFDRFATMNKEIFLDGENPNVWTILLVSDCPTDMNQVAAVLPGLQFMAISQNEYRVHIGLLNCARLPEALINNNNMRKRSGKNPIFLACYRNAGSRVQWLLPRDSTPQFKLVGQRATTEPGLIYLAGFEPEAVDTFEKLGMALEKLGIAENAKPQWTTTIDGTYLIEAKVQDPEAFYTLNTEILGVKIQCLQARELELDHSRWKEWVFPPKAKDKIAAPPR